MEYHPDRRTAARTQEAQFKAISEAYDCLKDPQKRAAYDRFGQAAFQNGGGGATRSREAGFGGFSDIFETIFGEFMGPRGAAERSARRRPALRPGDQPRGSVHRRREDHHRRSAWRRCERVRRPRRTSADRCASACETCGGMGKVRAQQGFFVVERACPTCRGAGEVIADPCAELPRRGPGSTSASCR